MTHPDDREPDIYGTPLLFSDGVRVEGPAPDVLTTVQHAAISVCLDLGMDVPYAEAVGERIASRALTAMIVRDYIVRDITGDLDAILDAAAQQEGLPQYPGRDDGPTP